MMHEIPQLALNTGKKMRRRQHLQPFLGLQVSVYGEERVKRRYVIQRTTYKVNPSLVRFELG